MVWLLTAVFERLVLQLDQLRIAECAYVGIFSVAVQYQNQDQFWISRQKYQESFFNFFEKSKNELARPKTMFLVILTKI